MVSRGMKLLKTGSSALPGMPSGWWRLGPAKSRSTSASFPPMVVAGAKSSNPGGWKSGVPEENSGLGLNASPLLPVVELVPVAKSLPLLATPGACWSSLVPTGLLPRGSKGAKSRSGAEGIGAGAGMYGGKPPSQVELGQTFPELTGSPPVGPAGFTRWPPCGAGQLSAFCSASGTGGDVDGDVEFDRVTWRLTAAPTLSLPFWVLALGPAGAREVAGSDAAGSRPGLA
mmetsp:Transcript_33050/g.95697  ORF Transcript_33050/g.95697 Transcript_33050/m.95697 type:complete len:229 (+) Transcript_33050:255-941(+)